MPRFHALPIAVAQHVLTFVDGNYVVDVMPRTPQLPIQLFQSLATVSKAWRSMLGELKRLHDVSMLSVHLETAGEDEVQDMMERLQTRGARLKALTVAMGVSRRYIPAFDIRCARRSDEALDNTEIDWKGVFRLVPKLQRLDLSGVPMHSMHLRKILLAASAHCPEMKALALPQKEWHRGLVTSQWQPTMDTLYTALERWHHSTPAHGLIQLTLPQRVVKTDDNQTDFHALTDTYLRVIARFCPNIEYFDGWKTSYAEDAGRIHCQELLYCSRPAWEAFCASCTQLREVNWFVLPFINDFFDAFASTTKSKLEKLTLAGGDHGNYPDVAVFGRYYYDGTWSCSSESLSRVFQACPSLRELRVVFQYSFYDDRDLLKAVNDAALVAAAKHCPRLERLEIEELEHPSFMDIMRGITDAGVIAVAKLPDLRSIRLKSTACEAPGIISLLRHAPRDGAPRTVEMVIGNTCDGTRTRSRKRNFTPMHEILIEVLLYLLECPEDIEGRRFHMMLNGHANPSNPETMMRGKMVRVIINELQHTCPWLSLSVQERGTRLTVVLSSIQSSPPEVPQPFVLSRKKDLYNEVREAYWLPSDGSKTSWGTLGEIIVTAMRWPWQSLLSVG
ncbi:hypothetical protein Poli38472_005209 [Pythium oligandrum]|uniref:F-box domain-containing protein n=1 Tax=Pythium oligandrum TaxID=41045 RepID=A0A8K1CGX2_PYTOL|nr:hypothetical protein Poli38472_005209 [Pythium oligandrum]|eukprot:TMW62591.1 hypothetical protein Poli38472_005209 [Pythium oligandrum]